MKMKNRLKELREKKKITQKTMAVRLGVSQRHIAFLESGDREPSLSLALHIEKILGEKISDIFLPQKCT